MVSMNYNELCNFSNSAYITRVIKHELYHVIQAQFYGQNSVSNAAREFEAYYSQIFRFKKLKQILYQDTVDQLAVKMINYMNQMSGLEKEARHDMIEQTKLQFPKLCPND